MHFYAGVLLKTTEGNLLLQKRDDKPRILNPGMIAIFGGSAEKDETIIDCAIREVFEEINLKVAPSDLTLIGIYHSEIKKVGKVESHIFLAENVNQKKLKLHEGQNIVELNPKEDITSLSLTRVCRLALADYLTHLKENDHTSD